MQTNSETISILEHKEAVDTAVVFAVNEACEKLSAKFADKIDYLNYKLEKANAKLYGKATEKARFSSDSQQREFFEEPAKEKPTKEAEDEKDEVESHRRRKPSKARFPENAERITNDQRLSESERKCGCCGETMEEIGFDSSEKAELIPAKPVVREYRRYKYACKKCKKGGVKISPPAPTAFPKTWITDLTRAHLLVSKFVDHCPYYRQSKIFARMKVSLSDSSMVRHGLESADRLAPIVTAMLIKMLNEGYLQVDETTLPVLKVKKSNPGAHRGYLWAYSIPYKSIVFIYEHGRGAKYPEAVLADFKGVLQTDRYSGYAKIQSKETVIDIACWTHARRKFVEALKYTRKRAGPVLKLISALYKIEENARQGNLPGPLRAQLRQQASKPILNRIELALDELAMNTLKSTPLGEAIFYTQNNWPALIRYVDYGDVEIDNNLAENSMRPVALGRKNYMFAGSEGGAEAAATIYSITESCRRLKIDPVKYLEYAFAQLAKIEPGAAFDYLSITPAQYKLNLPST